MNLCRSCDFKGLCVVRVKLEENTVLTFPDGKVAIVSMEESMVSCEHYSGRDRDGESAPQVRGNSRKTVPSAAPTTLPDDDDLYGDNDQPNEVPPLPAVEVVSESEPEEVGGPAVVLPRQSGGVAVPYSESGPLTKLGTRKMKLNLSSFGGGR